MCGSSVAKFVEDVKKKTKPKVAVTVPPPKIILDDLPDVAGQIDDLYQGSDVDKFMEDVEDGIRNPKPTGGTGTPTTGLLSDPLIDTSIAPEILDLIDPPSEPDIELPQIDDGDFKRYSESSEDFGKPSLDTQAKFMRRKLVKRPTLSPRKGLALNPNYTGTTGLNIGYKRG